jgi:hypothetical protein
MSRSRCVTIHGEKHWFDMSKQSEKATAKQIELLATVEKLDIEDLLESSITQGEVKRRLHAALGDLPIPYDVLLRRQKWRKKRATAPPCRLCGRVGDSTKHHFVNRWILRELSGYSTKWSNRRANTIPVCIDCHRDLHDRSNGPVSIADKLTEREKEFADRALKALSEERPKLLILIARGDDSVYEARLVKDWIEGKLNPSAVVTEESVTLTRAA